MSPWYAKAIVLLASAVLVAIRAPHGRCSRGIKVVKSRKGPLEVGLLALAWAGFFIPLIWVVTPIFAFADYPLRPILFVSGLVCLGLGLWLFYQSHADLGTNWSITLEIREKHRLITEGSYRYVRHPMYLSLFLYALGQALVLPNWVAGPSYLLSFGLLFALRLGPEERMMMEQFGAEYETYMEHTKRLVPGIW